MDPFVNLLSALLLAALAAVPVALGLRSWGRGLTHGGRVDRPAWEMYAAEHGHQYIPDVLRPRIRGVHEGVSFDLTATIRRTRHRGREIERATTALRVTHRAALPPGTVIRRRSWAIALGSRVAGQRATPVDPDYDELFWVHSDDPVAIVPLLTDIDVKKAIFAVFAELPETVIHDRAIEIGLPGMASDTTVLSSYLDRVATLAKALRARAPQLAEPEAPTAPGAAHPPPRALPTAAELPERTERLYTALRRMGRASSRTSANVQASTLRLRPLEYTLQVRAIVEGATRLGLPTGGKMVRGLLERGEWRVEMTFGEEDTPMVEALSPGDTITGLCLVDDLRLASSTVECTATTPPILAEDA